MKTILYGEYLTKEIAERVVNHLAIDNIPAFINAYYTNIKPDGSIMDTVILSKYQVYTKKREEVK